MPVYVKFGIVKDLLDWTNYKDSDESEIEIDKESDELHSYLTCDIYDRKTLKLSSFNQIFDHRDLAEISLVAKALGFKLAIQKPFEVGKLLTIGIAIPI